MNCHVVVPSSYHRPLPLLRATWNPSEELERPHISAIVQHIHSRIALRVCSESTRHRTRTRRSRQTRIKMPPSSSLGSSRLGFDYPLDIPPRLLLLQELQQITSSMRRSPRWASPSSGSSAAYYSAAHRRQSSASGPTEMVERSLGSASQSDRSSGSINTGRKGEAISSTSAGTESGPSIYGKRIAQGEGEEMELLAAFVGLRRRLVAAKGE